MARLQEKRALITGGVSGIGLETLRAFVAEGARVAVTARSNEAFGPVRKEFGNGVLCLASDAGDVDGQKGLLKQSGRALGDWTSCSSTPPSRT